MRDASTAFETKQTGSGGFHGEYRQDKRALRGARASSGAETGDFEGMYDESSGEETDDVEVEGISPDCASVAATRENDRRLRHHSRKAITLSSLPRGYWATLFKLEVVKARNKPIEPPRKPEAAPFFLPTIHSEGQAEPSFPEAGSAAAAKIALGLKKDVIDGLDDGRAILNLPAGGGAVWADDDDDEQQKRGRKRAANGSNNTEVDEGDDAPLVARGGGRKRKRTAKVEGNGNTKPNVSPGASGSSTQDHVEDEVSPLAMQRSRILKQLQTVAKSGIVGPSRCGLATLLLECEEGMHSEVADMETWVGQRSGNMDVDADGDAQNIRVGRRRGKYTPVMSYLTKLSPPKVDVEMTSLCQGDWDEEGVRLVRLSIEFLLEHLRYEVVFCPSSFDALSNRLLQCSK